MRRSLLILIALLVASTAIGFMAYRLGRHLSTAAIGHATDDLDWLRMEFRLGDSEMTRIRQLHNGYLPQCQSFCDRIAAKKREVVEALGNETNAAAAVEQQLLEVATLRAQCQAAMLRHFVEVSRVMPPEQGRRYLAEMQRLTLGSHEQIERSMSGEAPTAHGQH